MIISFFVLRHFWQKHQRTAVSVGEESNLFFEHFPWDEVQQRLDKSSTSSSPDPKETQLSIISPDKKKTAEQSGTLEISRNQNKVSMTYSINPADKTFSLQYEGDTFIYKQDDTNHDFSDLLSGSDTEDDGSIIIHEQSMGKLTFVLPQKSDETCQENTNLTVRRLMCLVVHDLKGARELGMKLRGGKRRPALRESQFTPLSKK